MQQQPQQARTRRHRLLDLPLLLDQFVHLQPLPHPLQIDLRPANLLPAVMLEAGFLGRAAELAGQLEHVLRQRTAAHVVVVDLRVLRVFRAEHTQPLAVSLIDGVEGVAEHRVAALDARLEDAAEARLRLVLVEAAFHVSDGGARVDLVTARHAVHRRLVLDVDVILAPLVQGAALGELHQQVEFLVPLVQLHQRRPHDLLLRSVLLQALLVLLRSDAGRAVPLLDARREDLKDAVRRQLHPAHFRAVFRLRSRCVGAVGSVAVTRTFQRWVYQHLRRHRALPLP